MTLEQCCKRLLIREPFYGLFLLGLNKQYTTNSALCPTACVSRNGINVELLVNKDFWETLDDDMQFSVLRHELLHVILKHLTFVDVFSDPQRRNIAADCAVNSYIPNLQKLPYIYPSRFQLPDKEGLKYYYDNLPKSNEEDGNGGGKPSVDNHETWKQFSGASEAEKELINQQIDHLAKQTAEQVSKLNGSIPGEIKDYIDSLFKQKPPVFNWKAYFRRMLGNIVDITLKKTYKKESNRFPGCAGIKKKKKISIMVAIDTSGSVSNQEICDFFSEINHIYKTGATIHLVEFDHNIQREYKYNGKWDFTISGRGGTSFLEPINLYNKHKDKYSALVIFSDGYAPIEKLKPCGPVIWVITSTGSRQNYPGKTIYIPKENE